MESVTAPAPHTEPNLAVRLVERAARHPDRLAIVEWRGGRVRRRTFAELHRAVAGVAAGLRGRGIEPGSRVLVFVPMSLDLYVLLLAIHHAGGVAVFVDAWAGARRLDAAVHAARPRAFAGTLRAHGLRLTSAAVRAIPIALVAGGAFPVERLARRDVRDPAAVRADDEALVTFTTGSTGVPKPAVRSHRFLWEQHRALTAHLGQREDDVDMPSLPIFVLNNLAAGVTSVLPDFDARRPADVDPLRILRQMGAERVTTTSGSPAFYERIAAACHAQRRKIPVRALHTGGAPVLPVLASLLSRTVAGAAHVVYGSTEAEPIAGIETRAMLEVMAGRHEAGLCVGGLARGITLRLVRPHDAPIELGPEGWAAWEVGAGEVGEVTVTGAHVLAADRGLDHAGRSDRIADGVRSWHRTGDAARRDSLGRLWLMGRVKRRVVRDGATWWGQPVELAALAIPGVRHAAYFETSHPGNPGRAVLCVESDAPPGPLEAAARAAVAPAPFDAVHVLRSIPRDPRHRSKTDTDALEGRIRRGRTG